MHVPKTYEEYEKFFQEIALERINIKCDKFLNITNKKLATRGEQWSERESIVVSRLFYFLFKFKNKYDTQGIGIKKASLNEINDMDNQRDEVILSRVIMKLKRINFLQILYVRLPGMSCKVFKIFRWKQSLEKYGISEKDFSVEFLEDEEACDFFSYFHLDEDDEEEYISQLGKRGAIFAKEKGWEFIQRKNEEAERKEKEFLDKLKRESEERKKEEERDKYTEERENEIRESKIKRKVGIGKKKSKKAEEKKYSYYIDEEFDEFVKMQIKLPKGKRMRMEELAKYFGVSRKSLSEKIQKRKLKWPRSTVYKKK